jgi:biotin carboxylase
MNITTGATHVEFRLRGGVEPVLLEAAARLGGGPIYRSVQLSTGVDMVEAMLDLAAGRTPTIAPRSAPRPVGFRNIFPDAAGTLVAIHGVDEARADPAVDEIEIYRTVGDHLDVPPRTFQGHGHVIFSADTPDHLDEVFDHLVRTVRLQTRRPDEAQTSPSTGGRP